MQASFIGFTDNASQCLSIQSVISYRIIFVFFRRV